MPSENERYGTKLSNATTATIPELGGTALDHMNDIKSFDNFI